MAFCFRIRFDLSERSIIDSSATELSLADPVEGKEVRLKAGREAPELKKAKEVLLLGRPFDSEEGAVAAAERWVEVLRRAFAKVNLGADFGPETQRSTFTALGLQGLEGELGKRVLNDVHGISVFKCDPKPLFVRLPMEIQIGPDADRLGAAIAATVDEGASMTRAEKLAYDLYAASFFERVPEARFMMLMMAVETMIDPKPRSAQVRGHIDGLITTTRESSLPKTEIESIVSSVQWLQDESIGQAGRKLASRLGGRRYLDEPNSESATQFFTRCYTLRSRLVHGSNPRPSAEEVGLRAAHLEHFVANLLSTTSDRSDSAPRPPT